MGELSVSPQYRDLRTRVLNNILKTERGGSVVKHWTRVREFPGSNPGAYQSEWFFCGFPPSSRHMLGWIFTPTIHLIIIHQIHKL